MESSKRSNSECLVDNDLADFLDYSWDKEVSVEHFISVFHTRMHKISDLHLDDKLKGQLLLRQADHLIQQERHVEIGSASGSYDVNRISAAALRNIYRNGTPTDATHLNRNNSHNDNDGNSHLVEEVITIRVQRRSGGRHRGNHQDRNGSRLTGVKPTSYSFLTSSNHQGAGVIVDSSPCTSVVWKIHWTNK